MTREEAFNYITKALKRALKREKIDLSEDADLIGEKVLDSLEGIVFIMELTELTGKEFPEDIDLIKVGLLKIHNLIDYLTDTKSVSDFLISPPAIIRQLNTALVHLLLSIHELIVEDKY